MGFSKQNKTRLEIEITSDPHLETLHKVTFSDHKTCGKEKVAWKVKRDGKS